jgi:hypothetical protein
LVQFQRFREVSMEKNLRWRGACEGKEKGGDEGKERENLDPKMRAPRADTTDRPSCRY